MNLLNKDKKIFQVLMLVVLINNGFINYSTLSLNIIPFTFFINIILNLLLLFYLYFKNFKFEKKNKIKDLSLKIKIFSIYLFIISIKDLINLNFRHEIAPIGILITEAILYFLFAILIIIKINNIFYFLSKLQFLLFILALLAVINYYFPNAIPIVKSENYSNLIEGFKGEFYRYKHDIFYLSLISIFITILLFLNNQKSNLFFTSLNVVIQLISIFIANYRATIISILLFIMLSTLYYLISNAKRKIRIYLSVIIVLILSYTLSVNGIFFTDKVFVRLYKTENLVEDDTMQWRFEEAAHALSNMDNIYDYIFGVGYSKPFNFFRSKTFFLHNGYVSIFYNFGLIGAFLLILILYNVYLLIKNIHKKNKLLGAICIVFFVSILLQNFSEGVFNRGTTALLMFCIYVFIVSQLYHMLYSQQK
jgi:hypothetical protein